MIDLYCERLGPGILAEPINALTNLAFPFTAVFSVSLFLRSTDLAICNHIPTSTHFFWHLFNGLLVYLAFRGLLINLTTPERGVDS
jgi:hypothetical protein